MASWLRGDGNTAPSAVGTPPAVGSNGAGMDAVIQGDAHERPSSPRATPQQRNGIGLASVRGAGSRCVGAASVAYGSNVGNI
jgi:sensor histidine kinase regulating citrate/malate metabolism